MNPTEQNASPARTDLDRLLSAAAKVKDESTPAEMPFGFDTRVIALSRRNGNGAIFGALLRRVALVAAAVIGLGSGGACFELNRKGEAIPASRNRYASADSGIREKV